MRTKLAAARPSRRPRKAPRPPCMAPTAPAREPERVAEQAQARAGHDVVQAERHEQAEQRPRPVELVRRRGHATRGRRGTDRRAPSAIAPTNSAVEPIASLE